MSQKIYRFRLSSYKDGDSIIKVMKQGKAYLENSEWFVAQEDIFLKERAAGRDGFVVIAEDESYEIAGFFVVDYPKNSENNLGNDIGLDTKGLSYVAHMDTVMVLPEHRGHGLMGQLLCFAESVLRKTKYTHLLCTIHPDNQYSLNHVQKQGYKIMETKEKYGGHLRHILYKRLESAMPVVLVSACLLGVCCRYSEKGELDEGVKSLMEHATLIPVCPEIFGGLSTPRSPAERIGHQVFTKEGEDVTTPYKKGAGEVLKLAKLYRSTLAVLKERSPSCGSGQIYDGTYSKTLIAGDGITTELLKEHGILVFGESKTEELKEYIDTMENLCYSTC